MNGIVDPDWIDAELEEAGKDYDTSLHAFRSLIESSSENRSGPKEMVYSSVREGIVWYGSLLAAWSAPLNLILAIIILTGIRKNRMSRSNVCLPYRWLMVNFSAVQLVISAFVIPVHVITDRKGSWVFGDTSCRVWLMLQLLFVAETMWSTFVLTFDRFLYLVASGQYMKWSSCKVTSFAGVLGSWSLASLVLVPTIVSNNADDSILEELCATSLSPEHAFFVTLAAFVVPSVLTLIVSGAIMFVKLRNDAAQKSKNACNTYDQIQDGRYQHDIDDPKAEKDTKDTGNGLVALTSVNICCMTTWAPFYATNVIIPLCEGHMCIDPTLWSVMIWMGYTSAGVAPLFWFLDPWIRRQIRRFSVCSAGQELEKSVRFAAGSECSLETNSSSKKLVNAI